MSKVKALLFDLDGTIIDSEFFHYECWIETLSEYDVIISYEDWLKNYAGIPLPQNAKRIVDKYAISTNLTELIERVENLTLKRFKTNDIALMPFVLDFITYWYEKGLTLAVVTASPRADVEAIFERNGLAKYFTLFITRTDVAKSKPDPESYNLCVEKLGILKDECIVFEDTINGVTSAMSAGITCFAIQNNVRAQQKLKVADQLFLNFSNAKDYIVENRIIE